MLCNSLVIGPLVPMPIFLPSRELIGVTSAAVPVKKASSACKTSSTLICFSKTS